MPRRILKIDELQAHLPFTKHQIYKAIHHPDYPLPHKKFGKRLLFDVERVYQWFDGLPGKDSENLSEGGDYQKRERGLRKCEENKRQ